MPVAFAAPPLSQNSRQFQYSAVVFLKIITQPHAIVAMAPKNPGVRAFLNNAALDSEESIKAVRYSNPRHSPKQDIKGPAKDVARTTPKNRRPEEPGNKNTIKTTQPMYQRSQHFRIMVKIRIHDNNHFPFCLLQAAADRTAEPQPRGI